MTSIFFFKYIKHSGFKSLAKHYAFNSFAILNENGPIPQNKSKTLIYSPFYNSFIKLIILSLSEYNLVHQYTFSKLSCNFIPPSGTIASYESLPANNSNYGVL